MSQGSAAVPAKTRWTDGLTSTHWRILWGSFLGWIFDGYEALAPVFVMTPMLRSVLAPARIAQAGTFAGIVLGVTLIGWGIGGLLGGVFADYWGRKKVMLWSVLLYAVFSGATAFAGGFWALCAWRFLTGLAMRSEWSTGVALVSETWPERAQAKGG
ncbi:MFS transporter [Paraburkholderia acidicola]|uniref:MFS transporter n=1 Tax=Paraburkholderia acidicola TaxID=1912599 RepID=A0ABV1LF05_9BURK